jgi:hypothetical protein
MRRGQCRQGDRERTGGYIGAAWGERGVLRRLGARAARGRHTGASRRRTGGARTLRRGARGATGALAGATSRRSIVPSANVLT